MEEEKIKKKVYEKRFKVHMNRAMKNSNEGFCNEKDFI